MDELIAFLQAALDEEAAGAVAAGGATWSSDRAREGWSSAGVEDQHGKIVVYDEGSPTLAQADHIARWDPSRVLAEVEAKRARIDLLAQVASGAMVLGPSHQNDEVERAFALRLLYLEAQPLASRPGFKDEWRLTP